MELPIAFTNSLKDLPGYDEEAFAAVHASGEQVTSVRLNPSKLLKPIFDTAWNPVPWTQFGYYLAQRPSFTFDPVFHAGAYYVQEASSMLLEQAFVQHTNRSEKLRVLDLCAAPGGKSTHIQSLISPESILISNEVIRSRTSILRDNIIKWGSDNIVVLNNDPSHFAQLNAYFDVMLVDAPCSGSGLFRRDPAALDEWSPDQVNFCAQRQKRIVSDVWPALKENGLLIYATCSYSLEEDEAILQWLQSTYSLEFLSLQLDKNWQIVEVSTSACIGYRCWPHLLKGEGFFMAVCRKKEGGTGFAGKSKSVASRAVKSDIPYIHEWTGKEEYEWVKKEQTVFAWPQQLVPDLDLLLEKMQMVYAGVRVGELTRNKLLPDHALAMSGLYKKEIRITDLNYEMAIAYLQRKEFEWPGNDKGWQLVSFRGFILGWVNVLPNRMNNYYPKEFRILKDK